MPQIARNGNDLFNTGFNLTGGPQGITPIDSPGFGNRLVDATGGFLPANFLTTGSANVFFWVALLLLGFTIFCSLRLRDSRLGRAWIAIREDEIAASAMGIPLMRTKTWAYAMGAFFGGLAGAYYASFKSSTFPQDFYFNISVFILCMVILGGMGNVWGVILGAAFLEYLNVEGLANIGAWLNEQPRDAHRRARVPDRDLRRADRGRHAAPPAGPAPERAAEARVRARHARRVPLRRRSTTRRCT